MVSRTILMRKATQAATLCLALSAWVLPALGASGAVLDPARVGWSAIEMTASKFFLSASATVTIVAPRPLSEALLTTPAGQPVVAGPLIVEIRYDARLAGQQTDITLIVDPSSAAALQMVLQDSGRRQRERRWRFTDIGVYLWTRWPANEEEAKQQPQAWSDRNEGLRKYQAGLDGRIVTDATGLLYALAAASLQRKGDRYEILEFSRRNLHLVTAEVRSPVDLKVDFNERRGARITQRRQNIQALRISLRGSLLQGGSGEEDEPFKLMGLSDDIEVALDPVTRMPLQISGSMPYVGKVVFRLKSAALP